jgi:hypothetical protein
MTPRPLSRPIHLALVLVVCAVILSARFFLSHATVETAPPPAAAVEIPIEHPDELPPLW